MNVVLDPNVLVSALLSPAGAPAKLLMAWTDGAFELIASPKLMAELERVLGYPKIAKRISAHESAELVDWLSRAATQADDPTDASPVAALDKDDDYLLALAYAQKAMLVSGDKALLALGERFPVLAPARFLATLDKAR